jgi:hypothetical protein
MVRKAVLTGLLAGGVAVGGLVPVAAAATPAVTFPAGSAVVTVTMDANSMSLSQQTVAAGRISFKAVSGDGQDHELQVLRLRSGYTQAEFGADMGKVFNGDVKAIRRVDDHVVFRGGAETHTKPGYMTVPLKAHTYFLLDIAGNAFTKLKVTGSFQHRPAPTARNTITAFSYGFGLTGALPHQGWIRERNVSDQPHFFVFNRVKADTTYREVKRYFASGAQGQPPFALRANISSGVISPYTDQQFYLDLPAGRYVVMCFWPDDDTGMPHAMMGMWKLITLS